MFLDKIKGQLACLSVGDSLGGPFEMRSQSKNVFKHQIYLPIENYNRYTNMTSVLPPGTLTDDSEMSITLLRSIVANGKYNKNDVLIKYMKWANTSSQLGKNTKNLFKGVKTILGYENRWTTHLDNSLGKNVQGNGSLMRCSFIALLQDYSSIARIDASLTNPNEINAQCSLLYILAIRLAYEGKNKQEIIDKILEKTNEYSHEPEVLEALHQAIGRKRRNIVENKGHVVHGLYAAIYTLISFDTFDDVAEWVCIFNRGSDTDTILCISGALFGAYYGYEKLMSETNFKYNFELVRSNRHRPVEYTLYDFESLTEKAYNIYN